MLINWKCNDHKLQNICELEKYATHTHIQILNICIESGLKNSMQKYFVANLGTPFLQKSAIMASSVFLKESLASKNFVKFLPVFKIGNKHVKGRSNCNIASPKTKWSFSHPPTLLSSLGDWWVLITLAQTLGSAHFCSPMIKVGGELSCGRKVQYVCTSCHPFPTMWVYPNLV